MNTTSYIITGPTASGKSDFAHALARRIGGTIINCDSVQIYSGISAISASPVTAPPPHEIDGIPYMMFSILTLAQHMSVAEYLAMARRAYDAAIADGRTPIFVGGTGYYINAILNGISPMPDIDDATRKRAREMVAHDLSDARKMLPANFTASDPQRVARALEIFLQTGKHITEFQGMPRVGAILPRPRVILINPPADILRERIAERVPKMIANGAIDEAQHIIDTAQDPTRAIGATQLVAYIRGEISMDACIENWVTKTQQYAKRQRTWFRTQLSPDIIINHTPTTGDIDRMLNQ